MNSIYSECPHRTECFYRALQAGQAAVGLSFMNSEVCSVDPGDVTDSPNEFTDIVGKARFAAAAILLTGLDEVAQRLNAGQPSDCATPEACPTLLAHKRIVQ